MRRARSGVAADRLPEPSLSSYCSLLLVAVAQRHERAVVGHDALQHGNGNVVGPVARLVGRSGCDEGSGGAAADAADVQRAEEEVS